MMTVRNDDFRLAWWRITKDELRISKADRRSDLVALTVNGATPSEMRSIKSWCKAEGGYRVMRTQTWSDSTEVGGPMWFRNNETTILALPDAMARLETFLATLPKRDRVVMIQGATLAEVRRWCRGHVVRIVEDEEDPNMMVISLADGILATELALRSD